MFGFQSKIMSEKNKQDKHTHTHTHTNIFLRVIALSRKIYSYDQDIGTISQEI